MDKLKVIVAGGRDFDDYEQLCVALAEKLNKTDIIISGGAKGADTLAEKYAKEFGHEFELFPAEWKKFGNAAGPIRNLEMAEEGDKLIVFWNGTSSGTKNMIKIATKKNIPMFVEIY